MKLPTLLEIADVTTILREDMKKIDEVSYHQVMDFFDKNSLRDMNKAVNLKLMLNEFDTVRIYEQVVVDYIGNVMATLTRLTDLVEEVLVKEREAA